MVLYETPQAFVRLETGHGFGKSFHHPANVSPEQMSTILRGVLVEEPVTRLPLYDDLSIPRLHGALTEEEVALFSPLLSLALGKATAEEVVTFYRSSRLSGVSREVTSGGMYMRDGELHLLLSNNHSTTHAAADIGVADTTDDRLTPLRSLAPQKGTLRFEPARFQRAAGPHGLARLFHWDRRELIILVDQVPSATAISH
jgi:hypothetical protein